MLAFGHTSSGVLVGLGLITIEQSSPSVIPVGFLLLIAVLLGVLVHYLGDFIPHGHYDFAAKHPTKQAWFFLALDFAAIGLLFTLIILQKFGFGFEFWIIFAAVLGAQLPDIFEGLVDRKIIPTNHWTKLHRHWHFKILHWHTRTAKRHLPSGARALQWTDVWQVAVFALALVLLIRFS